MSVTRIFQTNTRKQSIIGAPGIGRYADYRSDYDADSQFFVPGYVRRKLARNSFTREDMDWPIPQVHR